MKYYAGVYTALITPFSRGKLDEESLVKLVKWQIDSGIHGLVLCATTGEGPTLSYDEFKQVLEITNSINQSRVKIIFGASSNNTTEVIKKINDFSHLADCALVCAPYYNKPLQSGIYLHFKMICENIDLPLMVYDVPSRCAVSICNETMLQIMDLPKVVAVKDATGNITRPLDLQHSSVAVLSGDDVTALGHYTSGGDGLVSVTSNVFPDQCVALYDAFIHGNIKRAMLINQGLFEFNVNMFVETNPIPVKYALSLLQNYINPEYRLPLTLPTDLAKNIVKNSFKKVLEKLQ